MFYTRRFGIFVTYSGYKVTGYKKENSVCIPRKVDCKVHLRGGVRLHRLINIMGFVFLFLFFYICHYGLFAHG